MERSIIFSTEMVKAIREGRKTQTRRVLKPQPPIDCRMISACGVWSWELDGAFIGVSKCPYGQVGDKLWVREVHKLTKVERDGELWVKAEYRFSYENDDGVRWFKWVDIPKPQQERLSHIKTWGKWRSPRFMYKFLARIWLEITEIEAKKLNNFTAGDAMAEGYSHHVAVVGIAMMAAINWYRELWDSLNAKCGWDTNPWVFVISFKLVT